ncbi:MAG: dephospho-CoA kinase [Burkholderiales bacterium]
MTFVVGLTGGIGSGKSAAAEEFGRLGAAVVDADAIAHELTRAGGAAIDPLRRAFGPECLDDAGAMDRARMRRVVFSDPDAKRRLEALLHPMIRAEAERRIAAASAPYVVHVVPLLLDAPEYRKRVARVLVVDCPPAVQVERVQQRSGLDADEVRRIIDSQTPRGMRLAAADDVIDNSGSLDALHKQVRALHERYLAMARTPA